LIYSYNVGFISFILTLGTNETVSFLTVRSLAKINDPSCLISADDAPIFTRYFPASAIHDELSGSKEEILRLSITNVIVWDSPG